MQQYVLTSENLRILNEEEETRYKKRRKSKTAKEVLLESELSKRPDTSGSTNNRMTYKPPRYSSSSDSSTLKKSKQKKVIVEDEEETIHDVYRKEVAASKKMLSCWPTFLEQDVIKPLVFDMANLVHPVTHNTWNVEILYHLILDLVKSCNAQLPSIYIVVPLWLHLKFLEQHSGSECPPLNAALKATKRPGSVLEKHLGSSNKYNMRGVRGIIHANTKSEGLKAHNKPIQDKTSHLYMELFQAGMCVIAPIRTNFNCKQLFYERFIPAETSVDDRAMSNRLVKEAESCSKLNGSDPPLPVYDYRGLGNMLHPNTSKEVLSKDDSVNRDRALNWRVFANNASHHYDDEIVWNIAYTNKGVVFKFTEMYKDAPEYMKSYLTRNSIMLEIGGSSYIPRNKTIEQVYEIMTKV